MTTKSLTEGNHNIQVTLTDYDTLNAVIDVTADGVLCVSVAGDGACGGSGLPRVEVSGMGVKIYLKEATTGTDVCSWITSIGGWKSIEWTIHVLKIYDAFLDHDSSLTGFIPEWNDVLVMYDYFLDEKIEVPTQGNANPNGCGFT